MRQSTRHHRDSRPLPPLALYVHLPWCERKCPYGDFNSYEPRSGLPEDDADGALHDLHTAISLEPQHLSLALVPCARYPVFRPAGRLRQDAGFIAPPGYARHRPETTLLYRLVAEHYPTFRDRRAAEGRALPRYVEDEFEAYLKCGLLEHGLLRVKCESCQAEKLVAFSCKRRGFSPSCGARRMAETAALLVDGVLPRQPVRQWVLSLPFALRYLLATRPEVVTQVPGIVYRAISGHLIRKAGLTRASAVTGTVTLIQRFGSALNLNVHFHKTLPAEPERPRRVVAESSGFSLHAGIAAKASQRDKLEHLARYVSRPPVATERLSLTEGGQVRCALKTPYRDGTTHVIFEPEDFIARLAALVPKPRAHLTRYHSVFAPASPNRARVVPSTRATANKAKPCGEPSVTDRQRSLTWAQRLKRVFAIDIEVCRRCGGKLRVITSIEDASND